MIPKFKENTVIIAGLKKFKIKSNQLKLAHKFHGCLVGASNRQFKPDVSSCWGPSPLASACMCPGEVGLYPGEMDRSTHSGALAGAGASLGLWTHPSKDGGPLAS